MDELRQYADLGASTIRDVLNQVDQDPEKASEILRGFTTAHEPSEEEINRKLQQLQQYAHLGNDVLRKLLREKDWNVEDVPVAIVAMQARSDEEERKIRELEMNFGDIGKDKLVQVLQQNNWNLEKSVLSLFEFKQEQERAKRNVVVKEERNRIAAQEEQKRALEEQKRALEEQKRIAQRKEDERKREKEIEEKKRFALEEKKRITAELEEKKRVTAELEEKKRITAELEEKKRFAIEEKKRITAELEEKKRNAEKDLEAQRRLEEQRRIAAEKELEDQRRQLEAQRRLVEEQRRIAAQKELEDQRRQLEARLDQQRIAALEEKLRILEDEKKEPITRRPMIDSLDFIKPPSEKLIAQGQLNIEASTTDFILISPESQPKPQDLVVKIKAEPDHADYGERITYHWEHSALPTTNDWIGLYREGSLDKEYLSFQWLDPAKSGSFTVSAPATPGTYVFKYFVNKSYVCWAVSNPIKVGASFNLTPTILSSSEVSIRVEQLFGKPSSSSWVALYEAGKDNRSYVEYYYLEGKQQVSFKIPKSGKWEFRAFHLKGYDHTGSCFVDI